MKKIITFVLLMFVNCLAMEQQSQVVSKESTKSRHPALDDTVYEEYAKKFLTGLDATFNAIRRPAKKGRDAAAEYFKEMIAAVDSKNMNEIAKFVNLSNYDNVKWWRDQNYDKLPVLAVYPEFATHMRYVLNDAVFYTLGFGDALGKCIVDQKTISKESFNQKYNENYNDQEKDAATIAEMKKYAQTILSCLNKK